MYKVHVMVTHHPGRCSSLLSTTTALHCIHMSPIASLLCILPTTPLLLLEPIVLQDPSPIFSNLACHRSPSA